MEQIKCSEAGGYKGEVVGDEESGGVGGVGGADVSTAEGVGYAIVIAWYVVVG